MDQDDTAIRLEAFRFLAEQTRLHGDVLPLSILRTGFPWGGEMVPIMNGAQGIFKPRVLRDVPLSIMTAPQIAGKQRPYDDGFGHDDLLVYRYQGNDPDYRDNRGLRLARERHTPLIYLSGMIPGRYVPEWPVYIVGDDPAALAFTVDIRDRESINDASVVADAVGSGISRRYGTRNVRTRLHQNAFRERVLSAYAVRCAICRLRHPELLDAAHILADGHPRGEAVVPNGLSLCKLHHAAFDENIVGVSPDLTVAIRPDVLDEEDGPMLLHGLKEFHDHKLHVPRRPALQPNREFLEERFAEFSKSA